MTGVTKEIIQCDEREKACWSGVFVLCGTNRSGYHDALGSAPDRRGPRNLSPQMLVPGESDQRVDAYVWRFGKRLYVLSLVILSLA